MKVQTLQELLTASSATEAFKAAVQELQSGRSSDQIQFRAGNPSVKVLRVVSKLLEEMPEHEIEQVEVEGRSGCSDYSGRLFVNPGSIEIQFEWDCAWRAKEAGMVGMFGSPNQQKAAREYGYQCFRVFKVLAAKK